MTLMIQSCHSENENSNKLLFPINKSRLAIAKRQSSISTVFSFNSSPNDCAASDGGGVDTFWSEQCTVTTFTRLLKTRSAASIVKDWQLWAIRAWIAHCARALKAVAPFINNTSGLGPNPCSCSSWCSLGIFKSTEYWSVKICQLLIWLVDQQREFWCEAT